MQDTRRSLETFSDALRRALGGVTLLNTGGMKWRIDRGGLEHALLVISSSVQYLEID